MKTTQALLEAYYTAFNAHDRQGMLALLTEDVVHDINQAGPELGKAAFAAFLERMDHSYREQLVELVYLVSPDGTRAAAEFVVLGTYVRSDVGLPEARGQTYRLRGAAGRHVLNLLEYTTE